MGNVKLDNRSFGTFVCNAPRLLDGEYDSILSTTFNRDRFYIISIPTNKFDLLINNKRARIPNHGLVASPRRSRNPSLRRSRHDPFLRIRGNFQIETDKARPPPHVTYPRGQGQLTILER